MANKTVEMTKVVIKKIKISDIKLALIRGYSDPNHAYSTNQKYEPLFKFGLKLIRKYRYELFGTFEGYQVITNGYNSLKKIKFPNNCRKPIEGNEVINKLIKILENK